MSVDAMDRTKCPKGQWMWCFSLKEAGRLLAEVGMRRGAAYELLWVVKGGLSGIGGWV